MYTCNWRNPQWTQRSCPQRLPRQDSSSLCSTGPEQPPQGPDTSLSASSSGSPTPGGEVAETIRMSQLGGTWVPRRPGIALLLRIASFHWLLIMIVWTACKKLVVKVNVSIKCLPCAFPFLLPSLRGSCIENVIPDHLFQSIVPLLVVLQRHIRAIVYQELYNVTTPFPVLRTRYSMSFTCWVPCWYNRLRPTWPHSEVQSCCYYLKRQFRSWTKFRKNISRIFVFCLIWYVWKATTGSQSSWSWSRFQDLQLWRRSWWKKMFLQSQNLQTDASWF